MGFSRQEYWSVFPCPPPGYLPDPRTEHKSPISPALQAESLPLMDFLVAQMVKNLPAMHETWVQFLGRDDPLQKGMATHSVALKISWTEEPGGLVHRFTRSDMTETKTFTFLTIGEAHGNMLF